jgi:hypothetical protein
MGALPSTDMNSPPTGHLKCCASTRTVLLQRQIVPKVTSGYAYATVTFLRTGVL